MKNTHKQAAHGSGERKALRVLILGRHRRVIDRILGPLLKLPLHIDWALRNAAALELLGREKYDIVTMGGGIAPKSRTLLKKAMFARMPGVQIIEVPRDDEKTSRRFPKNPIPMNGPDDLLPILKRLLS